MRIAIASDHAGFDLKALLLNRLATEPDATLVDLGTHAASPPVDYPDYARAASEAVVRGDADRAIVVCGSGAGACMAADKVPGARAFFAGDTYTAHQAVEHDDANVLCLGAQIVGDQHAFDLIKTFLAAEFSTDPYFRGRLVKLEEMERRAARRLEEQAGRK